MRISKGKRTKRQTMTYKTLHRNPEIEEHEPHKINQAFHQAIFKVKRLILTKVGDKLHKLFIEI
jgi:predicted Holliday junction resolvase-like endonuclease